MSDRKTKLAVIRLSVEMLVEVGEDQDKDYIEFWLNDSCHCLGTEIAQLAREDKMVEGCCFTCHRASADYLRDATPADIENLTPENHPRRVNGELKA